MMRRVRILGAGLLVIGAISRRAVITIAARPK
jgi:hypothetical protein